MPNLLQLDIANKIFLLKKTSRYCYSIIQCDKRYGMFKNNEVSENSTCISCLILKAKIFTTKYHKYY